MPGCLMAVRIYEISKKISIPSKSIIEVLQKGGFDAKNHMSVMTPEAVRFVEETFKTPQKSVDTAPRKDVMQEKNQNNSKIVNSSAPERIDKNANPGIVKHERRNYAQPAPRPSQQYSSLSGGRNDQNQGQKNKQVTPVIDSVIIEPMTPAAAAIKMGKNVNDIIVTLLTWGMIIPKNQIIPEATVARLADHFGLKKARKVEDQHIIAQAAGEESVSRAAQSHLKERLPIAVVVGHVDHGKTSLLDYIRKTRVAAKEKGGITQHIGAYEASTAHGNVIFLDTPGHEAFSKIRQRGVRLADIAILIVAADDGIMPQTLEAIKHIKGMKVPVMVAINKIDKVDSSRIDIVKQQLAQHDLLPEDWGGDVVCVPLSAKTGAGVDQLLELLVLQTQMLELKTDPDAAARGYILESEIEKGRGPVATLICQHGSVSIGDYFACGTSVGRVTSMVNSYGSRVQKAGPSIPVRIAGFEQLPTVGDYFEVVSKEEYLYKRSHIKDQISSQISSIGHEGSINILVKVDTNSTLEAVKESIEKISKKAPVQFHIVHASVGSITESDVELAYNTGSRIIGLHTKIESKAGLIAQQRDVSVQLYDIIYKMLEALEAYAESQKEIEYTRQKTGTAHVLKVFDIKKLGIIAGCMVKDGTFVRKGIVIALRHGSKVGEGKISSLQRDRKTVKEVHAGYECGFIAQGFQDWQEGDVIECYIEVPKV